MLPADAIRTHLDSEPKHRGSFYDLFRRNVKTGGQLFAAPLALTLRAQVCRRLLELSENRIQAHMTQDSLGTTPGVARPTRRRSLNSLAELGSIESKYRRPVILDRGVLERFKDER